MKRNPAFALYSGVPLSRERCGSGFQKAAMYFSKLEGLGNDFLIVSADAAREKNVSGLAQRICDRHYGIGADGLLIYSKEDPTGGADFGMRIFNADGGEAEL